MNSISEHRRNLQEYQGIDSRDDLQAKVFTHALERYKALVGEANLGSVLTVCSAVVEANIFSKYSFSEIMVTGLNDLQQQIKTATNGDPRISYQKENAEALSFPDQSFDLVFCKYGLHHLPRPTLGMAEMLRCCRKAIIFIEPFDSLLRRILEQLGLTTLYERQPVNVDFRDNYVFPFSRRHIQLLLNAYYLDSGYRAELHYGWYSQRYNVHRSKMARQLSGLMGWTLQFVPGSPGNLVTTIIFPGKNLPSTPVPLSSVSAISVQARYNSSLQSGDAARNH